MKERSFATPAIKVLLRKMGYELIDTLPVTVIDNRKSRPAEVLYALPLNESESELALLIEGGHEDRYYGEVYYYQWEIKDTQPETLELKSAEEMKLCWHWKDRRRFNEEPTEEMIDEDSMSNFGVIHLSS